MLSFSILGAYLVGKMNCRKCHILEESLKWREKFTDMLLDELRKQDDRVCDLEDKLREQGGDDREGRTIRPDERHGRQLHDARLCSVLAPVHSDNRLERHLMTDQEKNGEAMSEWRPTEDWENPWSGPDVVVEFNKTLMALRTADGTTPERVLAEDRRDIYEAGADAIVVALKLRGERWVIGGSCDCGSPDGVAVDSLTVSGKSGTLVFIPDEKKC